MERTENIQILAGPGQTHVVSDDFSDIDPVPDLIDHIFRNQTSAHESRGSYFPTSRR